MASACVNNVGISSEKFLDCAAVKCPSYGWISPRISFSCDCPDEEASIKPPGNNNAVESSNPDEEKHEDSDPEISCKDFIDFEFRLDDPVKMLPADELFSDGKLVPLHLSTIRRKSVALAQGSSVLKSEEAPKSRRGIEIPSTDPYLFSPKAPSCSSIHWKELLGLKKLYQNSHEKQEIHETSSSSSISSHIQRRRSARSSSVKQFLLRGASKSGLNSSLDSSSTLPLLNESDNELPSISSRLSLSSSSPGHLEYGDLPRHSLDSDKPSPMKNHPRARAIKKKSEAASFSTRVARSPVRRKTPESAAAPPVRDVSADSPRMISSGKILFHSLERSSSSPSTLNGGPRYKHRGMERSNSAHVVRVTPVLNVPVCTIRGLFSSPQKVKDGANAIKSQQHRTKNRTDRV